MTDAELTNFVDEVIVSEENITKLLTFVRDWNTNRKFSALAQRVLSEILDRVELDSFPNA